MTPSDSNMKALLDDAAGNSWRQVNLGEKIATQLFSAMTPPQNSKPDLRSKQTQQTPPEVRTPGQNHTRLGTRLKPRVTCVDTVDTCHVCCGPQSRSALTGLKHHPAVTKPSQSGDWESMSERLSVVKDIRSPLHLWNGQRKVLNLIANLISWNLVGFNPLIGKTNQNRWRERHEKSPYKT